MSDKIRVALADDELAARKRLTRLLEAMPEVEVVGVFESAAELLASPNLERADVLLLDINMPDLTGLDAAAMLSVEDAPYVIFVTAHSDHALAAFELGALDYVLKPVDAGRLKRAIERARRALGRDGAERAQFERLAVATRKGIVLVDPAAIASASYDGQLVTLNAGGTELMTDWKLADLEARMPDGLLLRVHRRYLLNLAHVERLEPLDDGGYTAVCKTGARIPIARQAARTLRKRLGL